MSKQKIYESNFQDIWLPNETFKNLAAKKAWWLLQSYVESLC